MIHSFHYKKSGISFINFVFWMCQINLMRMETQSLSASSLLARYRARPAHACEIEGTSHAYEARVYASSLVALLNSVVQSGPSAHHLGHQISIPLRKVFSKEMFKSPLVSHEHWYLHSPAWRHVATIACSSVPHADHWLIYQVNSTHKKVVIMGWGFKKSWKCFLLVRIVVPLA